MHNMVQEHYAFTEGFKAKNEVFGEVLMPQCIHVLQKFKVFTHLTTGTSVCILQTLRAKPWLWF